MTIIPVILSGGAGTRLWPLSRSQYPKQFLSLAAQNTMIQETLLRLEGIDVASPIVICNESHRFIVADQLAQINVKNPFIILEPLGRNTAPAIAAGAFKAQALDKDAVMVVLPSDHVIQNKAVLAHGVELACKTAAEGFLVTFGITPTAPETGYGYIKAEVKSGDSVFPLDKFVEKPNRETAQKYLDSGEYFWNSGMFVFKASTFLAELQHFEPEIFASVEAAYTKATVDVDFIRLEKESFATSPSRSIDYAVMEKTSKGKVIPLDAGWNDVGAWSALWEVNKKDENQNVIFGDVLTQNTKDSYIYSQGRLVAAVGLRNMVVVETKDAVLVAERSQVQGVKDIVEELKRQERHSCVEENQVGVRPWGSYEAIERGHRYKVKHITVKPGAKLSVQMHYHRAEHWIVVSGTALVRNGDQELLLGENQSTFIPLGTVHALENPGKVPLELIEVQSGPYLEEDDIIRFEDRYGRC